MYKTEVASIKALRDAFPNEKKLTLAKRIAEGDAAFESDEHKSLARSAVRTYLSAYSVIRRYDASKAKVTAKAGRSLKKIANQATKALATV